MIPDLGELARQRRKLTIPEGDVTLADGLVLRFGGSYPPPGATEAMPKSWRESLPFQEGYFWQNRARKLAVIATIDTHERHGPLLHVSLSHPNVLPTWEEVRLVRDAFFPSDVDVIMWLPRKEDYVSIHNYTFHLNQSPIVWGSR